MPTGTLHSLLAVAVLGFALTACGTSEADDRAAAGAAGCKLARASLTSDRTLITSDGLSEIKTSLRKMDTPTRHAFARVITVEDTIDNYFDGSYDPSGIAEAMIALRATCLGEHSIELPD
jgi:hypothetical protein